MCFIGFRRICATYHDDDEIKPAPSVREVLFEAEGQPFDQHFQEENHSEDSVHVIQDVLQNGSCLKMHVFQGLDKHYASCTYAD